METEEKTIDPFKKHLKTIHEAIGLFMLSSSTISLMDKVAFDNPDPIEALKLDAYFSKILPQHFSSVELIEKINKSDELRNKFRDLMGVIIDTNKQLTALAIEVNGED
jgi:hypothetical protein